MPKSHALGLLLLRLAFGLVIAAHGAHHLATFSSFVHSAGGRGLAVCAILGELAGGLGLAVGLFTRLAGLGMGVVMLSVAFGHEIDMNVLHTFADIGHTMKGLGFEYPFLMGILGIAFVFTGAGDWSLDAVIFGRRRRGVR